MAAPSRQAFYRCRDNLVHICHHVVCGEMLPYLKIEERWSIDAWELIIPIKSVPWNMMTYLSHYDVQGDNKTGEFCTLDLFSHLCRDQIDLCGFSEPFLCC